MATYNGDSSQTKRARNDEKVADNFQLVSKSCCTFYINCSECIRILEIHPSSSL